MENYHEHKSREKQNRVRKITNYPINIEWIILIGNNSLYTIPTGLATDDKISADAKELSMNVNDSTLDVLHPRGQGTRFR
jgi:hypothetical protein